MTLCMVHILLVNRASFCDHLDFIKLVHRPTVDFYNRESELNVIEYYQIM